MNKQAQGAQWSPREQGMLNAKYGDGQKHHYVPLGEDKAKYKEPPIWFWLDCIWYVIVFAAFYALFGYLDML